MGVIEIIVAALASGAAAGLKPTAEQVVKDAYAGLKNLITRKYSGVDLAPLEKKPDSQTKQGSVAEDLAAAGGAADAELLAKAQALLEAVARHEPAAAASVGIDLAKVKAASLRIQDVEAQGGAATVSVHESEFTGEVNISNIRAGATGDRSKKA